ncbi:MAG TPA: hypothetical protein VH436_06285 [Vicinamibacterales bacterium]
MIEVGEILVTSGGTFVSLQVGEADDSDRHVCEDCIDRPRGAVVELNSRNAGQHFDAHWRPTQSNYLIGTHEERWRQLWRIEAELANGGNDSGCRFLALRNPDIDIRRGARVAVKADCIAIDDEVLNAVGVQQFQELAEVGR